MAIESSSNIPGNGPEKNVCILSRLPKRKVLGSLVGRSMAESRRLMDPFLGSSMGSVLLANASNESSADLIILGDFFKFGLESALSCGVPWLL